MAVVAKRLYKGVVTNAASVVYTVPTNTTSMIKAVTLCNTTDAVANFNMRIGGTDIISNHQIKARDTVTIPFLDQIMNSGEAIHAWCTPTSAISVFISGKEVT